MTALSEFALVWMGAVVTGLAIIAFGTGIERLRPAQPQTLSDTLLNAKYLFPLHAALFSDASPGPVKYAVSRVKNGFPAELRAPMTEPSQASKAAVDAALAHAGLL